MPKVVSDEKLLEALLVTGSVAKASAELKISKTAIYKRFQNNPELRSRYEQLQTVTLSVVATALTDSLHDAVRCLQETVNDREANANARISASDALLRHCCRYVEMSTILRRLDEIEQTQKEQEVMLNEVS